MNGPMQITPPSSQAINDLAAIVDLISDPEKLKSGIEQLKKVHADIQEALDKNSEALSLLQKDAGQTAKDKEALEKDKADLEEMKLVIAKKTDLLDSREASLAKKEQINVSDREEFLKFQNEKKSQLEYLEAKAQEFLKSAEDKKSEAEAMAKEYEDKLLKLKAITG